MSRRIDESVIKNFYNSTHQVQKPKLPFSLQLHTLTNTTLGIGDTVILTALPRIAAACGTTASIHSYSDCFRTLVSFNPYYKKELTPFWVAADALNHAYDLGNGHFIQRIQRAYGFRPELRPHGCIVVPDMKTIKGRIALHFQPGIHVKWQRQHVHPRAREVYPGTIYTIQHFIHQHPEFEFSEVGKNFSKLRQVDDWTNISLEETIKRMSTCEYFIGIISGPLHIAAALGLKIITIINFPDPTSLYLPILKNVQWKESEWLYPQSVILHQEAGGKLVPRFTLQNLERAIQGEIYPYWSEQYLDLIEDCASSV